MGVSSETPAEVVSVVRRVLEVPQDAVGGSEVGSVIMYCDWFMFMFDRRWTLVLVPPRI